MPKLSLLILPTILAVAVYLLISSFNTPAQMPSEITTNFPSNLISVSEGINTISYDEQGAIAYTLQAERQIQKNDDTSELHKPVIRLFKDDIPQWNIEAISGNISAHLPGQEDSSRRLTLIGQVQLINLDGFGNQTQLDTDFLTISPDTEIAETDRQVFLRTTNIEQSARGMIANFGSNEITFLSNSEGRYVPTSE